MRCQATRPGIAAYGLWVATLSMLCTGAAAQEPDARTFVAAVFDAVSRQPVEAAFAAALGTERWATTDRNGSFRLDGLPAGTHTIRIWRVGYTPTLFAVSLDTLPVNVLEAPIVLRPIPTQMPELVVEAEGTRLVTGAIREFYRRRRENRGRFLTREEITEKRAERLDQVLRGIPGVDVNYTGNLQYQVSMTASRFGNCPINFYIDGLWSDAGQAMALRPEWLEGIEVYRRSSEIPAEFNRDGLCGVIALWTRR